MKIIALLFMIGTISISPFEALSNNKNYQFKYKIIAPSQLASIINSEKQESTPSPSWKQGEHVYMFLEITKTAGRPAGYIEFNIVNKDSKFRKFNKDKIKSQILPRDKKIFFLFRLGQYYDEIDTDKLDFDFVITWEKEK